MLFPGSLTLSGAGVRQCGEQRSEGGGVLHRLAAPAGRGGRPPAPLGLPQRVQDEVTLPLHQTGSGAEQCRQSQVPCTGLGIVFLFYQIGGWFLFCHEKNLLFYFFFAYNFYF